MQYIHTQSDEINILSEIKVFAYQQSQRLRATGVYVCVSVFVCVIN